MNMVWKHGFLWDSGLSERSCLSRPHLLKDLVLNWDLAIVWIDSACGRNEKQKMTGDAESSPAPVQPGLTSDLCVEDVQRSISVQGSIKYPIIILHRVWTVDVRRDGREQSPCYYEDKDEQPPLTILLFLLHMRTPPRLLALDSEAHFVSWCVLVPKVQTALFNVSEGISTTNQAAMFPMLILCPP